MRSLISELHIKPRLIAIIFKITAVAFDYMDLIFLEISFLQTVTSTRRAVSNSSTVQDLLGANIS